MENETIEQIPVEDLHVFRNHTFQVKDDEAMKALMESIRDKGIVLPLLAFTNEDGEPELISGHRRLWVARELRLETVPVIMKKVDRSEATLLMGISNFMNRQKVLPSERGFTYAAMLKALKADKNRENGTARDLLAKRLGEDARQISRFIRLTELIPDLLKLVDAGKLGLRPASELSYLSADTQAAIFQIYTETGTKPEMMSIKQMREIEEERDLDAEEIRRLLAEQDGSKKAEEYKMVFYSPVLCAILKNCHSISEREDRIIRGLKLLEEQDKERRAKREEEQRIRIEEIRKQNQEGGGDTYGG